MNAKTIAHHQRGDNAEDAAVSQLLRVLNGLRADVQRLHETFDEYARVNLNARYPYGEATDRWRSRR